MEPQEKTKMDHLAAEQLESDVDDLCRTAAVEMRKPKPSPTAVFEMVKEIGREHRGLQQQLLYFINTYLSVQDEFKNEEITLEKALSLLAQKGAVLRESTKKYISNNSQGSSHQEEEKDATQRLLQKNKGAAHALQMGIMKNLVFVGQAPILPMIAFDRDKLQRMGIPSDNFSGYACLTKQTVLGVSLRFIDKLLQTEIDNATGQKAIRLRNGKRHQELFEETVQTYLRKHPGFAIVGNANNYWEAQWFWLVSNKELAILRQATFANTAFKVGRWGFAFAGGGSDLQHLKKLGPFQKQAEDRHFADDKNNPLRQNPGKHQY